MASAGQDINYTLQVGASPDQVMQTLVAATTGLPDYQVTAIGSGSLVLTRRYIPTWAIAVAVLGFIFFLIGLLALLYKETEVITVTLASVTGGTQMTVTGRGALEMVTRINAAVGSSPALTAPAPLPPEALPAMKCCPRCTEEIKVAAYVCRYCGFDFRSQSTVVMES